jgi:nitrate/nitrite-specific signal transduction histidine kinase
MKLKKTYIIYFAIILGLLLINQAFIQYSLYRKQEDARTINIAGRQRMLSQKLSLLYYVANENPQMRDSILRTYDLWANSHYALLNGDASIELPPIEDKSARRLLEGMSSTIENHKDFIASSGFQDSESLTEMIRNLSHFLFKMNQAVDFLQDEADAKLRFVKIIEVILAVIAMITLYIEFRYLVLPAQKAVIKKNEELDLFNSRLKKALHMQNHIIREPLTSLLLMLHMAQKETNITKREQLLAHLNSVALKIDSSVKKASEFFNEVNSSSLAEGTEPTAYKSDETSQSAAE